MEGFLDPQKVLNKLKLREDMVAADFGSGSGGWAIPLAKILKEGKVYAIDILEEPLSALVSRMRLERVLNIDTIRSNVESPNGSKLTDGSVDLVLMTNLLFEVEDKKKVISEAKRILKKRGKILIVDWRVDAPFGPVEGRISPEEVKEIAKDLNLEIKKEFEAGRYHWGLVLTKL